MLRTVAPGPALDAPTDHDDLRDTLGLDSLDFLDFLDVVTHVSERTGRIEEDDYDLFADLAGWVDYLTG